MKNYHDIARRRWTNAPIIGTGRFAVMDVSEQTGRTLRVFLAETPEQQRAHALGCNHAIKVDLEFDAESALAKMRDPYDKDERRRERRA
jgi:hypothetical protein